METRDLVEAELVARARQGEHAAFDALIRRCSGLVHRIVGCVLRDVADVEDAMQQAYVSAYSHLAQFEERSTFSAWVAQIALREAIACRGRRPVVCEPEAVDDLRDRGPDPEQVASAHELARVVEGALASLAEPYRVVLVLRELEGLSTREVARTLGISEDLVKVRLHRARALLADALGA